ncbi:MAG: RluA family pseudouridine synthase [Arcobacteraceae bacterium]|jgi:23S rRNA pseudouridine1911/1915/1917 synthase|nr:RluA family pseudouridine synthase [Arcobacteraceae bacterium]
MTQTYIANTQDRVDKFLSQIIEQPRNQIEALIKNNCVKIDNKVVLKSGQKLKIGQEITVEFKEAIESQSNFSEEEILQYDIKIIYEDEYILIVDKPVGLVIHDAPSVKEPTLVDWLKLKKISLSTLSGEERHGIVHRLDKGTSGLLVVAKTNEAHTNLSAQLEDKSMGRYYIACIDIPLKNDIVVEKPIGRNPNQRLKMAVTKDGRYAKTAFKKLIENKNIQDNSHKYELICAKLFTGRTHQIRVHLESLNRRILGDDLYGFKGKDSTINRIFLHAFSLYLRHPITNENFEFVAPLPQDMQNLLNQNFDKGIMNEKINKEYITSCFTDVSNWL